MAGNTYLPPFTPLQQKLQFQPSPSPLTSSSSSSSTSAPIQLPPLQRTPPQIYRDTMASSLPTSGRKLAISKLMSPPEHILDSFSHGLQLQPLLPQPHAQHRHKLHAGTMTSPIDGVPNQPMLVSPPISPYVYASNESNLPAPSGIPLADPILYPNTVDSSNAQQTALFPAAPIEPAPIRNQQDHIIANHIAARSSNRFGTAAPPTKEDYRAILNFKFNLTEQLFNSSLSAREWLAREKDWLKKDRRAQGGRSVTSVMPKKASVSKPKAPRAAAKPDRILKPSQMGRATGPRLVRADPSSITSPSRLVASSRAHATPEPHRRTVAPNREDKNFAAIPDYCPPLDSLPPRPHCMKIDWKGQPIDLSKDPNRGLLHPEEHELAGSLRLDCATYLTSKRRIFERRRECARMGKEFRKTDAQQACNIDVNKASKLWLAFEKVGWLDIKWVNRDERA